MRGLQWCRQRSEIGVPGVKVSGGADPRLFMASMECLAFIDYSLFIKTGAHYLLCTGTICKLGTKVCPAPRLTNSVQACLVI